MFSSLPEMKRKDREISTADCEAVLLWGDRINENGVISQMDLTNT